MKKYVDINHLMRQPNIRIHTLNFLMELLCKLLQVAIFNQLVMFHSVMFVFRNIAVNFVVKYCVQPYSNERNLDPVTLCVY